MRNTTVILGPPGTGKTTELLNIVNEYLFKNTDPRKIGFVSFTRKSVNEARDRAAKRFNKNPNFFFYFRTIHSLAFRQLSMTKTDVMEKSHYKELGDLLGVRIAGRYETDAMESMEKGDQLVFIESLARMCNKSLDEVYNDIAPDFSIEELELFQASLAKYKEANLVFDFTDMLTKFLHQGIKPELDVLFVDEAQDLCPVQWDIVEALSTNSKKTYIAGDDDQAIFRWSGADVDRFLRIIKDNYTRVLTKSYRLPKTVHALSKKVISEVKIRYDKAFESTAITGDVDYVVNIEDVDLNQGEWLILVRNMFQIPEIVEHVRMSGFAYETGWYSSKDIPSLKAALLWERFKKEKTLKAEDVRKITTYMSNRVCYKDDLNKAKLRQDALIGFENFCKLARIRNKEAMWYEILDKISFDDREYFIAARKRGETLVGTPRIKISTIHGAKGGEADNVLLFTDMSFRTYTQMEKNYEDEVRVFYVGATRAKKKLYIVQPKTAYNFVI